jgi:hypothetical protein
MPEVQKHGFSWEKDIIKNVYRATDDELKAIGYTSKMDLPSSLNRMNPVDVSIKTTCSLNSVCMADCLRVYDAVSSGKPIHMTVVYYIQNDSTQIKKLISITEVNLTNSVNLLFGSVTREQIVELVNAVKMVPQKRSPTPEEHKKMYSIRDSIQPNSGAIHFDIKCNSTQSRLQCSFNKFKQFLEMNPDRVIEVSMSGNFRGGVITEEISSSRRVFKKTKILTHDSTPHLPPL